VFHYICNGEIFQENKGELVR